MSSIASPAAANTRFTFSLRELIINYGILALLFALIVFFSFAQPAFFRVNNIFNILQAVSITALLGVGVTVTLIAGGFDLSVGGLSAFIQMAAAYVLIVLNGSTGAAIVACLGIGLAVGVLNATLIVRLGIPDLLATLGILFLLAGLQLIPTGGRSIAPGMTLLNGRPRRVRSPRASTSLDGTVSGTWFRFPLSCWPSSRSCSGLSWTSHASDASSTQLAATNWPRGWQAPRRNSTACWPMSSLRSSFDPADLHSNSTTF